MSNGNNVVLSKDEEQLFEAVKAEEKNKAEEKKKKVDVEKLKEKYTESGKKVYLVTTTVQTDDDNEEEFNFLFKKPMPASYDRYVKMISNSASKASRTFSHDNIVDEMKDELKETLEEYPAMAISLADKLLHMLGLSDSTSVKKL